MIISYTLNPQKVHVEEWQCMSKNLLTIKVLNHLNALEDEFETLWIEINTGPKSKNIIVCCA